MKCGTCGFHDPRQQACQLTKTLGWSPQDYCSKHKSITDLTCDKCGAPIQTPIIDEQYILCPECNNKFSTCFFCSWNKGCAFDEDATLPKTIQQRVQNGSQIFITEVRNPDLEKKTCYECKCYDHENSVCSRSVSNYCKNYKGEEK